jgi:hypothetical protein
VAEIPLAARLAREARFDYVSFKPFLVRADQGAEVLDGPTESAIARIRSALDEAKALATPTFAVVESTNLRLLESGRWREWTKQPRTCHFQAFRQVLSPLGLYNCPAHRGVEKARIAGKDAFATEDAARGTAAATASILDRFDASRECAEVTCLYHSANWWIEAAVEDPALLDSADTPPGEDFFL